MFIKRRSGVGVGECSDWVERGLYYDYSPKGIRSVGDDSCIDMPLNPWRVTCLGVDGHKCNLDSLYGTSIP